MKKLKFTSIIAITILFLTSCSNDDNGPTTITGNYFPSTVSDYWNYDVVEKDNEDNTTLNLQDYLTVKSGSNSNFELEANSGNDANGVMTSILTNGTLTKTESTLLINGKLEIPIDGINDFYINFNNALLYDLNASKNSELSNFTGEFTQNLQGPSTTIPLKVSYVLSFNKIQNQNSLKVGSTTYNKVTGSTISLNLAISTVLEIQGVNQEFDLLTAQDVLSINSYFGENVGLLKSDAVLNFDLDSATVLLLETLNIELNIPTSQSASNSQSLTTYFVAN